MRFTHVRQPRRTDNRSFVSPETFDGPLLDKQRAARSPFQSFAFPSNVKTRACGGWEGQGQKVQANFYLLPSNGELAFFAGSRIANKRSFAPREL